MTAKEKQQERIEDLLAIIRELSDRIRVQNLKDELLRARAKSILRGGIDAKTN